MYLRQCPKCEHIDYDEAFAEVKNKNYTVILQAPHYVDSDHPLSTYHVTGFNPKMALDEARREFADRHQLDADEFNPIDIATIAVFEGHHGNLAPDL